MPSFIAKRIVLFVPTLVLVTIIVFVLLQVVPQDRAAVFCGPIECDDARILALKAEFGTDKHILVQYGDWFINMWRLDFGISFYSYGQGYVPAWDDIRARLPFTLELDILAMLMAVVVAVPLGMASAITRGARMYHTARVIATMWASLPNLGTAILLIFLLVKGFDWLPAQDYVVLWSNPGTSLMQMVFPALALSFAAMVPIGRAARWVMMETLGEGDTRRTGGDGPDRRAVEYRYALKKALPLVVIIGGYEFGRLLAGAVVIEVLFNIPGMGRLLINSVILRDFPMVQGTIIVAVVVVMVWNLALDVAYAWVNPRVRYS